MLRSEIQELGWVPPSRRLSDTLQRADRVASEQKHRELSLEHVLLGLTEDTDAARVLEANGVEVVRFRDYVARYLVAVDDRLPDEVQVLPVPDDTLRRIFDVASAAAESSGRSEMDGALIVAAIIGEGTSNAAELLSQHGLNVDDDDQVALAPDATVGDGATNGRAGEGHTSNLSAVHEMLSAPIETGALVSRSNVTNADRIGRTHPQRVATPQSASPPPQVNNELPALQRTRPKAMKSRPQMSPPKAAVMTNRATTFAPDEGPPQQHQQTAAAKAPVASRFSVPSQTPHARTQAFAQSSRSAEAAMPTQAPMPAPPAAESVVTTVSQPQSSVQHQTEERPAPPPVQGFAQFDVNILKDILPARMKLGQAELIEIRVLNSDIDALTGQAEGRDVVRAGEKLVSRSLSLRLRSPSGGFSIEPRSPEVQWMDANAVVIGDEATSWRWQVTGHRRGNGRLQLQAAARTVSSDGTVMEMAMPDQSADIRIQRGIGAVLKRFALAVSLVLIGGILGLLARPTYRIMETFLLG